MKSLVIAVSAVIVLSGCSVYRSGQTPDDVYYSPAPERKGAAYVQTESGRDDGRRYNNSNQYSGYDDFATSDDRWLMMRVRNRARWSAFDYYNTGFYSPLFSPYGNWGYGGFYPSISMGYGFYNPYSFSYNNHFNNYYNWNSFYNPYYPRVIVVNPKTNPAGYNRMRSFDFNRYNNSRYNNTANGNRKTETYRPRYNNGNNSRVEGNRRGVFSNGNTNRQRDTYSRPNQDRPVRTYEPSNSRPSYTPSSSSGSGSSSSGSSGSSSGSRPSRR